MNQSPSPHDPLPSPHAIEGTWAAVRLEYAGEAAPDMVLEKTEVVFRDGSYTVRFGGETSFHGSYTISGDTLHIVGRRDPGEPVLAIRGIYQLVGNRLRICLGMDGVAPENFATTTNSQHYLGTYRRIA